MQPRPIRLACLALIACSLTRPLFASTLYGSSASTGSPDLYTINQQTGFATILGPAGVSSLSDLTSDTRQGSFRLWGGYDGQGAHQLVQFNPATGFGTPVGSFGASIIALAFDTASDRLFGTTSTGLYTINTSTGAATFRTDFSTPSVYAMAFRQGVLYGIQLTSSWDSSLVRIDPDTGAVTVIGECGVNDINGLACRPEDGVMFGISPVTHGLYTINLSTGLATNVGLSGYINGIAFSSVPSPSCAALFGALLLARRRTRSDPRSHPQQKNP